jgi:hypothetical protein
MASVNRKLKCSIFDSSPIHTPSSLCIVMLPDQENRGKAVGTLLLSCNEAEINDVSFLRPVNDMGTFDFQHTLTSDNIPTLPVRVARS